MRREEKRKRRIVPSLGFETRNTVVAISSKAVLLFRLRTVIATRYRMSSTKVPTSETEIDSLHHSRRALQNPIVFLVFARFWLARLLRIEQRVVLKRDVVRESGRAVQVEQADRVVRHVRPMALLGRRERAVQRVAPNPECAPRIQGNARSTVGSFE